MPSEPTLWQEFKDCCSYWIRLREKAEAKKEAAMSFIGGVIGGVFWLATWYFPRLPDWLETKTSAFLSASLAIWAIIFLVLWLPCKHSKKQETKYTAIIDEHEERLKPRLTYRFENGNLDCYSDDDGPNGDGKNPLGTYLRLLITNDSTDDVTGVHAVLTRIDKDGKTHQQNRRPLLFSPHRPGDPPEKTIKPKATEIIDLFRIDVRTNTIQLPTKGHNQAMFVHLTDAAGNDLYHTTGTSILYLEITANHMQMVPLGLSFDWQGTRRGPEPTFLIRSVN